MPVPSSSAYSMAPEALISTFCCPPWIRCFYSPLASLVGSGKESACQEDMGTIPGSGRSPWRRRWQPTSVVSAIESHMGQRSLVCSVHGVAKSRAWLGLNNSNTPTLQILQCENPKNHPGNFLEERRRNN